MSGKKSIATMRATDATSDSATELIIALEKATEPDRELDAQLSLIANPGHSMRWDGWIIRADGTSVQHVDYWMKPYTKSVDAAMTLVPRPMCWNGGEINEDNQPWACITDGEGTDYAATGVSPAVALCIAALRALNSVTDGRVSSS